MYQPDLPARIAKNIPFTPYNRKTFYKKTAEGYIDYTFADEDAEANYKQPSSSYVRKSTGIPGIQAKL